MTVNAVAHRAATRRPSMHHTALAARRSARRFGTLAISALLALGMLVPPVAQVPVAAAATNTVTLSVVSARTEPLAFGGTGVTAGAAVTAYKWMINLDNTGTTTTRDARPGSACSAWSDAAHTTPNPAYPGSCGWASIAGLESSAPVVAQGTEADLGTGTGITLEPGRYLISVLADGYKLDGTPFSIPSDTGVVVVPLQPTPLPTTTIKAEIFADVTEANGQYDPGEDGIAGFLGHITDYLGQVNTDVFGNPLCTKYQFNDANNDGVQDPGETIVLDGDQSPIITHLGGKCLSGDINMDGLVNATDTGLYASKGLDPQLASGELTIPNLGTNRYALSVVQPTGSSWVQTTTLEGNHDWDAWQIEGATGYDTEFVVGGEPFPAIVFGFVPGPATSYWNSANHRFQAGGTGTIKGVVDAMDVYIPQRGGLNLPTQGFSGAKIDHPIDKPWIALSDLGRGDTAVYIGRGNADGTFQINNVPDGTYTLTYWDEPQDFLLDLLSVTVLNGETVDMGILPILGWWTPIDGYIFSDTNRNGKRDAGEPGVPNFTLTMRKRENSLMDRGTVSATTDQSGHYYFESTYPLTEWIILEAYDDRYYTTGVTYQADNQPVPTTDLGSGVDVSLLPIIGLSGTIDWGVHAYDPTGANGVDPQNGGIVGSISYDTTRNELDPQYAVAEDWQPGVQGITVELHAPVPCLTNPGTPCDARGDYELNPDGSYAQGKLLNTYVSETWEKPTGCIARDVDGNELMNPADQQVLPVAAGGHQDPGAPCLEGPLMGVQFGTYATDQGTPDANFGAAVDGNYGFGDACIDGTLDATDPSAPTCTDGLGNDVPFTALDAGDYLVHIDLGDKTDDQGNPIYKVTKEEDINIGNGDSFVPQVPPPSCAGALHTVDVANDGTTDGYPATTVADPSGNGGADLSVPASTPIDNATFLDIGASPYEGQARPLCDTKLVNLQNGKSVVPMFNVFTDVPLPGRFFGYNVDDLTFSTDPKSLLFGEKAGLPFNPVGIYDFTNRLITTVETDYNGVYDVLLPSTNRINCPTPSGVCSNVYRFVGNDPGVPGRLNENYNPRYRTIAADFEAFPGLISPADTAPTQVGVVVQLPGGQPQIAISCPVNDPAAAPATRTPELFAVSRPYATGTGAQTGFTISGRGFGNAGQVTLDGVPLATSGWTDTLITVASVPNNNFGPHQLRVTAANGKSTINGLTFHRLGGAGANAYNPPIYEVGPNDNVNHTAAKVSAGRWFTPANTLPATANHAIQNALNAAPAGALVVVYPNNPTADPRQNPRGAYYENLIISKRVKLQGVGPGSPTGNVKGSIIDGGAFAGDSPVATDWYTRINALTWAGNQTIFDGADISLYLPSNGGNAFPTTFSANTAPSIDGFDLRGGDQQGFPGNITEIGGVPTGQPGGLITQGGAVFANAYARNLQITNNIVQNNGGAYGTIRIGNPDLPAPDNDNQNDGVRIANNRIIQNAGTNLAGGIGIFEGADGYAISGNDVCGNFSAEYGGGISQYGRSSNGSIDHNRVYYNQSYDEGGGIMVAGELPTDPSILTPGSGPVTIHDNLVQANMANDDGGGIRFLMAGNFPMTVYNNMIVNNVSTHEGGGLALDDAPKVRLYNNTIVKNVTTATAVTSDGQPAPAGLSTGANSALLQATLPAGSPAFSNPLLLNNIFWDNRAGTNSLGNVLGIGQPGDATPVNNWDIGVFDGPGLLAPTNSIVQQNAGSHPYTTSPSNSTANPGVVSSYDTVLDFAPWRTNPNFVGAILVAADLPPAILGDYHLASNASPAYNAGAASKAVPAYAQPPATLAAPASDFDGEARPGFGAFDIGADELAPPSVNLSITKTDGLDAVAAGAGVTYTIVVSNAGPSAVTGAAVTDTFPAVLAVTSWTCTATAGSSCTATGAGNNRTGTVSLTNGGSATYTANATVSASAAASIVNTATVAAPAGTSDPNPADNSATDTDLLSVPPPALGVLDNFNRANANTLGASWSQLTVLGAAAIRVNANQASAVLIGSAIWNGPGNVLGASQGAAFTFANTPGTGVVPNALILKASAGAANNPTNFIRVGYDGTGSVVVATTTNGNTLSPTYTTRATFAATFASGDTLAATAGATGTVTIYRTSGAVTTLVGTIAIPTAGAGSWTQGTGGGRIGIQLPTGVRVDDFSGGNVP
jgi:uncharacterized repeat protein (TIGR01451 family)